MNLYEREFTLAGLKRLKHKYTVTRPLIRDGVKQLDQPRNNT